MSSYSCVTARLTMRSVLHTQGDSRSRSDPVIGLVPRPSMASCYSRWQRRTSELYAHTYITPGALGSVWNPYSVGRRRKKQEVRAMMTNTYAADRPNGDHDARG